MTPIVTWTSRPGQTRLEFYSRNQGDREIVLIAKLFQKNVRGEFTDSKLSIDEEHMTIEMENVHALMRGISQRTFCLSDLNTKQKMNIMKSLENRNITVERESIKEGSLTIHAL